MNMDHGSVSAGGAPGTGAPPARRSSVRRIAGAAAIEQALEIAALTLEPDEVSGRRLVQRLMPQLFKLRKRAFSFVAITRILNNAIGEGGKLQPGTVKAYYNEFIVERMDECSAQLAESMKVMAQVEKITARSSEDLVAEVVKMRGALSDGSGVAAAKDRILAGHNGVAPQRAPEAPVAVAVAEVAAAPVAAEEVAAAENGGRHSQTQMLGSEGGVDDIPVPELLVEANAGKGEGNTRKASRDKKKKAGLDNSGELPQEQKVLPVETAEGVQQKFKCLTAPVGSDMHPSTAQIFSKNPPAFFSEAILEHPGIPGLMLTHDQRLVKLKLEYVDDDGVIAFETAGQSYNRLAWKKPAAPSPSRTEKDFVKMRLDLFP